MKRWVGLAAAMLVLGGTARAAPSLRPHDVLVQAERVADWQLAHRHDASVIRKGNAQQDLSRGWVQATFDLALTALADRVHAPRYRDAVLAEGRTIGWRLGDRLYSADDQLAGAAWLWAAEHGAGPAALAGVRERLDAILAHPSGVPLTWTDAPGDTGGCLDRWCWADALFMAPPLWFEFTRVTGDPRYAAFADAEFKATTAFLRDPGEGLWFRDSRFFDRRDAAGRKVFWARGNGWVFAALARILQALPADDPRRAYYEDLFRAMAVRLKDLQRPDGFWSPSLLADAAASPPETSGTGFFVYGMAWGARAGLLQRAAYEPAIRAGWAALAGAVQPDGRLGWVQQIGDGPQDVLASDTELYGTAAFVMAAAAIADLRWD